MPLAQILVDQLTHRKPRRPASASSDMRAG
jgi:hypothetical protein